VEKEETIRERIPEDEEKKLESVPEERKEEEYSAPMIRRRTSPREHASTRSVDAPVPRRRRRWRTRQVKKIQVEYLVEWEGYDPSEATWEPAEHLIKQGLQPLIDDYHERLLEVNEELELATTCTYSASRIENGVMQLQCMFV
jgi:hypothetical protein